MNIFVYHPNPETSASWLDDVRKNKMILESCQLMSTAMNLMAPGHGLECYKTAYVNHPCAIWARESLANFLWLLEYTKCLHKQRGKSHACASLFPSFDKFVRQHGNKFKVKARTPFVNCARNTSLGLNFTGVENVLAAYRLYHKKRWESEKPTWNHGQRPFWV